MAEPHHPITPADQEADLFFKFQMKLAHWLYGYWKQGLVGIGIFLFFAFVVGQTSTCIRDRAREGSAALARSQALLPEPSQMAQYGLAPLDDLTDPEHVAQLEDGLGIRAVGTTESTWRFRPAAPGERGAQIDLVIDRQDRCINLCEMKYSDHEFVISRAYAEQLRRKRDIFRAQTGTRKTLFLVMVTTCGTRRNDWYAVLIAYHLTMDDLFR